jgi:phosphopantetheinyl transferase
VDITAWDPQKEEIDFLLSLFTQEDSDHCRKYHFFDDQKRAIVSRLLQRHGAAVALGIPHQHVTIKRTKGRKPYITNSIQKPQAPNYNYSISHEVSNSTISCVCVRERERARERYMQNKTINLTSSSLFQQLTYNTGRLRSTSI